MTDPFSPSRGRAFLEKAAAAALRLLPAETGHRLAVAALARVAPGPATAGAIAPNLEQTVFGIHFSNPVGLAAGFDKDARTRAAFARIGWGFVEVGGVTPLPQPGNPRPRLFRLPGRSILNRMGFNSEGLDRVGARLEAQGDGPPVFVNFGVNRTTPDPADDWVLLLQRLYGRCDGFTLNVSSPNTPGLVDLQQPGALAERIIRLREIRDACARQHRGPPAPLLVKLSPDLADDALAALADTCRRGGIDGIIATNTSQALRAGLCHPAAAGGGGVSGALLAPRALQVLQRLDRELQGALPVVSVGGIATAADAYARIRAGATLVQLYSAMVWEGPGVGPRIARGLSELLERDGFASVADAVGADRMS